MLEATRGAEHFWTCVVSLVSLEFFHLCENMLDDTAGFWRGVECVECVMTRI